MYSPFLLSLNPFNSDSKSHSYWTVKKLNLGLSWGSLLQRYKPLGSYRAPRREVPQIVRHESTLDVAERPVVPGSATSSPRVEILSGLGNTLVKPKPPKGTLTLCQHLPPKTLSPPEKSASPGGRISLSFPSSHQKSLLPVLLTLSYCLAAPEHPSTI